MFKYSYDITNTGLAYALRDRPTLRSLSISSGNPFHQEYRKVFATSHFIDSLVSLKGLTCLVLAGLKISYDMLYSIAREGLHLTKLVLKCCTRYSYAGIFCLLSKCRRFKHLDLEYVDFLNDHHVIQLSSFLGDLVSINLSHCDELTQSSLFTLSKNCPSLREIKMERIGSKSVENFDSLGDFGQHPQLKSFYLGFNSWLSDENIIMFSSIFPNFQRLNLKGCVRISEVPKLEVLKLAKTKVGDETLYVISKNCGGLLELSLENCHDVTEKGVTRESGRWLQFKDI
ncbi:hypothetical protein TSUD_45510 [Trifolium subterraneum]|nr:hypothetical protein TSUD_45510 [Trifolium subterraneum]